MEKTTLYLLCSLIEMPESVSTQHFLYADKKQALQALAPEVYSCAENFSLEDGKFISDNPTSYEYRDQDGYGFQVWIEEITPID